jgi:hypothetical protein
LPDLTRGLQQFVDVLSTPSEARLQQQLDSGATALALASKWLDHWLGRVLAFLANSFFLLEMTAAVEVYGGGERLISVMQADTVEAHYLSAWNAVLRGERKSAQHFEAASNLDVADAFVQFGLLIGVLVDGLTDRALSIEL